MRTLILFFTAAAALSAQGSLKVLQATDPASYIDLNGNFAFLNNTKVTWSTSAGPPATPCSTGAQANLNISNNHVYWCTSTNSWTDITGGGGGGTPGGTPGQIQFNSAGSFGGVSLPASGLLKGAAGPSFASATSGVDYSPATSGTAPLKGNGSGGTASSSFGDIVALWASGACSGFLKNDGTCGSGAGSGSVTNVGVSLPLAGGPITTTGTITCPTCVTSAASLISTALVTGSGSQGSQTPSSTATLDAGGNISTAGSITGGAGSGNAGTWGGIPGTRSVASMPTNSMGWIAPASGSGKHFLGLPSIGSTGDQILLYGTEASSISTGTLTSFVNCGDATHALNFSTTTHLIGCQTLSGGGGGASYNYHGYTGSSAVDFSTYNNILVTASGSGVTITVAANPAMPGSPVQISLCNDTTARTWVVPTAFKRILPPVIASTCTYSLATWDGASYQGPGSDETASIIRWTTSRADPGNGNCPAGGCEWPDSTANNKRYRNDTAGNFVTAPVRTGVDINTETGQVTVTHLAAALPLAQGGTALTAVPGSNGQYIYNNSGVFGAKAILAGDLPNAPVTISTSGPVADPGGGNDYLFNNAAGALTFNLPDGVAGLRRCYRNATGKSGAITIAVTTSNAIDLDGANGTTTTGTLVSGGALGDSVCLAADASHHWYAYTQKGSWTNN